MMYLYCFRFQKCQNSSRFGRQSRKGRHRLYVDGWGSHDGNGTLLSCGHNALRLRPFVRDGQKRIQVQ